MKTPKWITDIKTPKVTKKNCIPIYAPLLNGNEKKFVQECMDQEWLSSKGDFVKKFEKEFAKYCNVPYAISTSSGTSAIFLALVSLGIKRGDEVIVPTFTMISTAFAVTYTGADVKFVDCLLESGNIDTNKIEQAITKKTKAIILVHVYGSPCNIEEVQILAKKYHFVVIEDAAEAIGSTYNKKRIGSISLLSTFSLYANKIVTSGEGGMITTTSKDIYDELKILNNYYFSNDRHFWHEKVGYNYRLSNIQAAIGVAQLEHIKDTLEKKRNIESWYKKYLNQLVEKIIPMEVIKNSTSNYWHIAYKIIDKHYNLMRLRNILGENGIETRGFFIPLHLQPVYYKKEYEGKFPNSEILAKTGFLLPSGPSLTEPQIKRVCSVINTYFK